MPERRHVTYFDTSNEIVYICNTCHTHIAHHNDIISKSFQGRSGKGYLLNKVVNAVIGPKEDRVLITGLHTVADLKCVVCATNIGWKYLFAFDKSQKYKEGKFIVEFDNIARLYPDFEA